MKDFADMQYHPAVAKLTETLAKGKKEDDQLFFRNLASYYITVPAAMMNARLKLYDDSIRLINMYTINLAASGFGKGRSMNLLDSQVINQFRDNFLMHSFPLLAHKSIQKLATKRAALQSTDFDEEEEKLHKEMEKCGELLFSYDSGSPEGIKQARNKLLMASAGSLNLEVDEIGQNLQKNNDVLGLALELYDGVAKAKLTKNTNDNQRSADLRGTTPANMLLFGDPSKILDDGSNEKLFMDFLMSGYARRCFFSYHREANDFHDIDAKTLLENRKKTANNDFLRNISDHMGRLANVANHGVTIESTYEAALLLTEYELYNSERSRAMKAHEAIHAREMAHRHDKAMRLAGAYAFYDGSPVLTAEHVEAAIRLAEDSGAALKELLKREHNHIKLARALADFGEPMTQAQMVETLPFFKGNQSAKDEMLRMAMQHGVKNNIVIRKTYDNGIEFYQGESLEQTNTDQMIFSFSNDIALNYEAPTNVKFEDLHKMTQTRGLHWANHAFKDKRRRDENAIPGFNMIVLDVDGGISLENAKELLSGYKALFYTTKSHTPDCNRFRIILPTNYVLKLDKDAYQDVMKSLFDWLPFDVDPACKDRSRKWETYPGTYEYTDGVLLDILPFIPKTSRHEEFKQSQLDQAGLDRLERWVVNNTMEGDRNNMLHRFARILVDAHLPYTEIRDRVLVMNGHLSAPLSEAELSTTVLKTVATEMDKAAQAA